MIEFKVISKNPHTGKDVTNYELFRSVEAAEQFDDANPEVTVDFDSMIDWAHSETKYEYA
jgi:hypothetical protein